MSEPEHPTAPGLQEGITLTDSICLADESSISPLASPNKDALAASNAIKSSTDELDTVTFGTIDDILSPMEDNQEMPHSEIVDEGLEDPAGKSASETLDRTSDSQATILDEASTKLGSEAIDNVASSVDVNVEILEVDGEVRRELQGLAIAEEQGECEPGENGATDGASWATNSEGFVETKVGSPGGQFMYEKGSSFDHKDESETLTKEPIRSISSYFAGVDVEESPREPRDSEFDFLGHASISPDEDTETTGRLKSVSCVLSQNSIPTEKKDRQSSMSNFFEMESADDTLDAMVAPPDQFAAVETSSKLTFENLVIPEEVRSRSSSQSSAQFDTIATPPITSDSSFLALDSNNHEAWIPSERTRACLVNLNTAPPGSFYPDMDQVTMPGVLLEESLGDPVRDLVNRFHGPQEAANRQTMNANTVPQDESGLRFLISSECLRSAVDLTGRLLTNLGQGPGKLGQPSRHTPTTLQLWLTRASLLMKLHMFTAAEAELEAFGNFDRADLYYSYYPQDTYPGKWGSLVPFGLRLIWAELAAHTGKLQESLDRLYYLLTIIQQILGNLYSGTAPDGSPMKQEGTLIWTSRRLRAKYAIANALCQIKDYDSGLKIFEEIADEEEGEERRKSVLTGVGRLLLQLGDVKGAREYFDKAEACVQKEDGNVAQAKIDQLMNSAYLSIGKGQFQEACSAFQEITAIDPNNSIAQNNTAVCLIYLGRLREALGVLESLVHGRPQTSLQDGVVFNLATLYELESSKAIEKKKQVLRLVAANKGDGFNPQCLKMM